MTDVFEVAKPKASTNALGAPVEPKPKAAPKPRQPPKQDVVAAADVVPVKKTRKKRTPRAPDLLDEHMLFMRLYNELGGLPKKARERLLDSLTRQLT
jgi:hypothetical protein